MNKAFFCFAVLLINVALPLHVFAFTPCAQITGQPCQCDTLNSNICDLTVCAAISPTVNFTVDMTNYSEVISAAIANQPIATVSTPACLAEAGSTEWAALNPNVHDIPLTVTFNTDTISNDDFINTTAFTLVKLTQSNGNYLGAQLFYCPCGEYENGSCTNGEEKNLTPGGPISAWYNDNTGSAVNLGWCGDTNSTGGVILQVYTPKGLLPAMGDYQSPLGVEAQSVKFNAQAKGIIVVHPATPTTFNHSTPATLIPQTQFKP